MCVTRFCKYLTNKKCLIIYKVPFFYFLKRTKFGHTRFRKEAINLIRSSFIPMDVLKKQLKHQIKSSLIILKTTKRSVIIHHNVTKPTRLLSPTVIDPISTLPTGAPPKLKRGSLIDGSHHIKGWTNSSSGKSSEVDRSTGW